MAAKSLGVALVTGASQGLGKAIALRLAKDGFRVALNDIPQKEQQLKSVSSEIERQGGNKTYVVPADVSKEKEVEQMVSEASKTLGGLDVMVSNAGIFTPGKLVDLPAETLEKGFAVNVFGMFFCYKHAARQMITQGRGGRIIGAASVAGLRAGAEHNVYGASKFAVRGLTQSAAHELHQYGITVNAYAPGFISSPMTEGLEAEAILSLYGIATPDNFKYGQPEDIASVVSYLASKEAHYITGQTVSPNGGILFT
jgi:acetoin reductase-like protein